MITIAKLRGWDFPIRINKETGKIKTVEDDDNIKKGVYIILNTSNNERKGLPDFGADVKPLLFHEVNATLSIELENRVIEAIRKYESHIKTLDVEVNEDEDAKGMVKINVSYSTDINDQVTNIEQEINIENFESPEEG